MRLPAWIDKWKQRHTFKIEITLALLFKVLLLTLLWYCFFSTPLGDTLTDQKMGEHIIGS
jgi:hypothetical protein